MDKLIMDKLIKYKYYIANVFFITFILYINVSMGFISNNIGILDGLLLAFNFKSILLSLISILTLLYINKIINKKLESQNPIIMTIANSIWLLYTNHFMSIISSNEEFDIFLVLLNYKLFLIATFGLILILSFEKLVNSPTELFWSNQKRNTSFYYIAISTFILLETNVAMNASYHNKEEIISIIIPNVIIIGLLGSLAFSYAITINRLRDLIINPLATSMKNSVAFISGIFGIFAINISSDIYNFFNKGIPFSPNSTGEEIVNTSNIWIFDAPIIFMLLFLLLVIIIILKKNNLTLSKHINLISDQLEEIKYINNFVYTQISPEQLQQIETEAEYVFIVSESLKFEQHEYTLNKIKHIIKDEMAKYIKSYLAGEIKTEPKYKFLLRDDEHYEESVEKIKKIYFKDLFQIPKTKNFFVKNWVSKIPSKYFDLLRPFPERTFLNRDGTMIKCEVIVSKSDNIYIIKHENITNERENRRFLEAFKMSLQKAPE